MEYLQKLRRNTHLNKLRLTRHLLFFFIFCIIVIVFVTFTQRLKLSPPQKPVALLVSNLSDNRATLSFVTLRPIKNCVYLFSVWRPQLKRECEDRVTNLHYFTFGNLPANTRYRILVRQGWIWRTTFIDPVRPILNSPSYTAQPLPRFKTSVSTVSDSSFITVYGQVVDK